MSAIRKTKKAASSNFGPVSKDVKSNVTGSQYRLDATGTSGSLWDTVQHDGRIVLSKPSTSMAPMDRRSLLPKNKPMTGIAQ